MPSIINRVPATLLQLLDIKARGQNPHLLLDDVRCTLDLLEPYMLGRDRVAVSTDVLLTGNTGVQASGTTVPAGEYWYVLGHSVRTTPAIPGAGDVVTYQTAIYSALYQNVAVGSAATQVIIPTGPEVSGTVGQLPLAQGARGYFLSPGDTPCAYVWNITSATSITIRNEIRVAIFTT